MKCLSIIFFALFLSSCSITERLIVLPNDEIKMAHDIDMSQLLIMGKSMGGDQNTDLSNMKKQDTVFSFQSILDQKKDSIALLPLEEQLKLKSLEKYHLKMLMDESQDQMLMTIFADFSSINELNSMMTYNEILNKTNFNPIGGKNLPTEVPASAFKTTYLFDGNVFKRTSVKKDQLSIKDEPEKQEDFDPENPNLDLALDMAKDLPINMTYKINYRFPKRIRTTSVKNAKISPDRMMVDFEFDMKTYENDPDFLNIEIYFE